MTKRLPCPPAPGPLEEYAEQFDGSLGTLAQRRGFREYLHGLLLQRDRHKTLTGLVGTEPVVGAQAASVQRLQFFLSESPWDVEAVNRRRLELVVTDPATAPHEAGVLVIDDSGDRKAGTKTGSSQQLRLPRCGRNAPAPWRIASRSRRAGWPLWRLPRSATTALWTPQERRRLRNRPPGSHRPHGGAPGTAGGRPPSRC